MLQYCRFPLPAPDEAVTCVAPHDDAVAVGSSTGTLRLLDGLEGSTGSGVEIRAHGAAVRGISWDASGHFVASCADDGTCGVHGRRAQGATTDAGEWEAVDAQHHATPLRCVALDPRYASRRERVFMTGASSGDVSRQCRGWLGGSKKTSLDDAKSPVAALRWGGAWVAWAADDGVKTMHADSGSPAAHVKPPETEFAGARAPVLFWEGSSLWIGWADVVLRVDMTVEGEASDEFGAHVQCAGAVSLSARADVVLCGLAPFDRDHVAVLGFVMDDESDGDEDRKGEGASPRPEVQLLKREDASVVGKPEALPVAGFEACGAGDYQLASTYDVACAAGTWRRQDFSLLEDGRARDFSGENAAKAGRLMRGSPPVLYVVSPRDVVLARVRDVDDQIELCLKRSDDAGFRDALAIANAFPASVRRHRLQDLVKSHLDALLDAGQAEAAAAACPQFLGASATLWEYWIFVFDRRGALARLAPRIPTAEPRLAPSVYDMVLERLLETDPPALLAAVKRWGHPGVSDGEALYSLDALMVRVDARAKRDAGRRRGDGSPRRRAAVAETVAELYVLDGQARRGLDCLLALDPAAVTESSAVFDLVEAQRLYEDVRDRVATLRAFSEERAADLLVKHVDKFPLGDVDDQLAREEDGGAARLWYLRTCFARLPDLYASADHRRRHADHARLYARLGPVPDAASAGPRADYDSEMLRFLRWSSFVPLTEAYDACAAQEAPLYDEMVWVLGKTGKTAEALALLLDKIGSVKRAVRFVEAHDRSLWSTLIRHALRDARFLGELLDDAGSSSLDVGALLHQIPEGTRVPGLRDKLANVFQDRRHDAAIHAAARDCAKNDCLLLSRKAVKQRQRGIYCEPPHEIRDGKIVVKPPPRFY